MGVHSSADASSPATGGRIRLKQHDRLQLELKVEHRVTADTAKKVRSELDVWFYLPPASGVGLGNYATDRFYEDLRVFTRLKTPSYSLEELCTPDDVSAPLGRLYERVRALPDGTLPEKREKALRRDCRLLVMAARLALRVDLDAEFDEEDPEPVVHSSQQLAQLARTLLNLFRTLQPQLKSRELRKRTRRCLSFADEYLSVLVEFAAVESMSQLEAMGLDDGPVRETYDDLRALARHEEAYRDAKGWRSVYRTDPTDPSGRAAFLDQTSLLKKYFGAVLYLDVQRDKRDEWAEHFALGLAAALAMTWAIGLQVFTFFALGLDLTQNMGMGLVFVFSMIAVVGYILKDRIKATVANALRKKLPQWLSDRRNRLFTPDGERAFGRIEERMHFVQSEEVPEAVREARLASLRTKLVTEAETDVLHYHRELIIEPEKARAEASHFEGLSDILRVNIWRWIRTFATTRKPIPLLNREGRPTIVEAPNEYVVDVLVRYRIGASSSEREASTQVHRERMFLNRRGILRVVPVDD